MKLILILSVLCIGLCTVQADTTSASSSGENLPAIPTDGPALSQPIRAGTDATNLRVISIIGGMGRKILKSWSMFSGFWVLILIVLRVFAKRNNMTSHLDFWAGIALYVSSWFLGSFIYQHFFG